MRYSYECQTCLKEQEEWHSMIERPLVYCHKCGGRCIKLISTGVQLSGMNAGKGVYDFVDYNTTGQPVKINSKRQWQQHLKSHGLNDDVKNDPYTKSELESKVKQRGEDKLTQRKKIKESLVKVYREKKGSSEFKQRAKSVIAKDKSNKLLSIV